MRTIVLGPPGTGKTHTLLEKVDDYLKTTNPDRIGYFAFTRKAANEAKERAMKKFNFSEDDLPHFRTLHSLAFRTLGIKKDQVMQKRHRINPCLASQFPCHNRVENYGMWRVPLMGGSKINCIVRVAIPQGP